MKRYLRLVLSLLAVAGLSFATTGCTDEELTRGAIGAAGGGLAGSFLGGGNSAAAGAIIGGLIGAGTARDRSTDYYRRPYYY